MTSALGNRLDIEFRDLCFTVNTRDGKELKILKHINGSCKSGRLLAIMGASGAGKTTLLDVLANNVFGGTVEGGIFVNGQPRQKKSFAKLSCYVQQKDVLLASATVREAVTTAALLKLPKSVSLKEKKQKVEDILAELELTDCADTLIGDELIGLKGISGGQKRRVSVGIELVKDPALVFLDEPTSGLDSEMALACIQTLRKLSRKGRTVVCTIHQPNSDITDNFDDFLLLARGRTIYNGLWATAVEYFSGLGYRCPMYKNPTDYFMSIVKDGVVAETLADEFALKKAKELESFTSQQRFLALPTSVNAPTIADATTSPAASNTAATTSPSHILVIPTMAASSHLPGHDSSLADHEFTEILVNDDSPAPARGSPARSTISQIDGITNDGSASMMLTGQSVPMWFQVWVLVMRMLRNWVRNPVMLASELVQYVFIALFVGLMYFKFNDDLDTGAFNRESCIWFAFAVMSFTPSYTAVTNWDKDRHLVKRELTQKLYSTTAFYLARTLTLVPFELAQCSLFVGVMYFFCGFQPEPGRFFTFLTFLLLFQLISESLGLICALITRQATYGIILMTFVLLLVLSFSGFLIATIPIYFEWLNKASYFTYAYCGLVRSQFTGLTFYDASGNAVSGVDAISPQSDNGLSVGANLGILAGQFAGFEIIKLVALHLSYRFNLM